MISFKLWLTAFVGVLAGVLLWCSVLGWVTDPSEPPTAQLLLATGLGAGVIVVALRRRTTDLVSVRARRPR